MRRVTAVETASRRSGISDSGEATSTEKLTPPPAKSRLWSTSWNSAKCSDWRGLRPVRQTTGRRSWHASTSPVVRFVAPGPDVAMQQANLPVSFASAAAMRLAFASLRTQTQFRRGFAQTAFTRGTNAPPCPP